MRKMICLLLTVAVVMSLTATVFGIDAESTTEMSRTTIEEGGYTFEISEMVDSNYSIIRTYSAEASAQYETSECDAVERIKAVLTALGMDEEDIALLSSDDIEEYAECEYITCETAYYKCDAETGEKTQIDEATALSESAAAIEARIGNVKGGSYSVNTYSKTVKENYLSVRHLVAYKGDAEYKFTTNAEWSSPPDWRGTDMIGSVAQNISISSDTRSASYSYYYLKNDAGYYTSGELTSYKNTKESGWYGSAVSFNLPNETLSFSLLNYRVSYTFNGHMLDPDSAHYFNSVGSYTHSTPLSDLAGISISFSIFGLSASIDFSNYLNDGITGAELEIYYKP